MHIIYVFSFLVTLLSTILAFRYFNKFWQSRRKKALATNENLREKNRQILNKNEKLQAENKDLEKKVGQAQNLYEIVKKTGAALEWEDTFQIFSKKIQEMFSFERAGLILLEEKEGEIAIGRTFRIAKKEAPSPSLSFSSEERTKKKGQDVNIVNIVNLFKDGRRGTVFIPNAGSSLRARRLSLPQKVRSFVAIPLIMGQKMLAIMTMENVKEDELDRLSAVAAQLALTINKIQLYQEVQKLSLIDGLTGTFLRRHFRERLEEEIKRSRQHQLSLSFLMADIDHFKKYNDKYGHLVGDAVLKDIAHLLEKGVREIDLVGRYGGEEFSLLLTETNQESALQVAERLRLSIEKHQFKAYDEVGQATISIGLATFPEDAQEAEKLIDKADRALYQAKQSGRNKVCVFT